jgi:predicted acyltransferase (DUF342 family)
LNRAAQAQRVVNRIVAGITIVSSVRSAANGPGVVSNYGEPAILIRITSAVADPLLIDERRVAWFGRSLILRGDLVASEDLTIDGTFEGTIEATGHAVTVTIGEHAAVKADLVAETIIISGAVVGNVTARGRLDLRASGSVEGTIQAPRFAMAEGAVLQATVKAGGR